MNWLVVVVVLIVAVNAYRGYKKGAIRMLLGLGALIGSVIVTGFLGPVISDSLCGSQIVMDYVSDSVNDSLRIEENINKTIEQTAGKVYTEKTKLTSTQQEKTVEALGLPSSIVDSVLEGTAASISQSGKIAAGKFAACICDSIARIIIRGITYVVLFLIARIALQILVVVLGTLDKIPAIEDASELAGGAVGALSGLLVVWVGFLFLLAFSGTSFGMACYACIDDSAILRFVYNNNLLLKWILYSVNS